MFRVNLKHLTLGLLLLLPTTVALAQSETLPAGSPRVGETRTLVLKTSPFDLLIPHKTTLWLGGEWQLAPRLSWQTDLGYVFRDDALLDLRSNFSDLAFPSTNRRQLNFNLKTEVRRYFGRDKGLNGFYGAGQLGYKQVNFNSNDAPAYDWIEVSDILNLSIAWRPQRYGPQNNYHVRQYSATLAGKLGYQHIFGRFAIDTFLGLGLRNERRRQDLGEPRPGRDTSPRGVWLLLPVLGGKLGYAF